jgi:hypothetical protein
MLDWERSLEQLLIRRLPLERRIAERPEQRVIGDQRIDEPPNVVRIA